MQLYLVPKSKAACDLSQLQKRILYKYPTCCFIGDLPDQWHPHCNSRTNSDDDNNYYHSCLLLIPPASICLYLHINISLSILTSALFTISLSVVSLLHVSLWRPPGTADRFSISLLSAGQRKHQRFTELQENPLLHVSLHPCISWFLLLHLPWSLL